MENALKIREILKSKKPKFIRQQGHGLTNLSKNWRAPKGMHSKLRKKLRGHIKMPSIGYSSPQSVRGFSPSGFKPILITHEKQLEQIKKDEAIILSKSVGERKRIKLLKKAREKNMHVLNIKSIDHYISQIEDQLKKRKQNKKEKKKQEAPKKEPIESPKKEETPEEKQKREKEEKRKVLEGKT